MKLQNDNIYNIAIVGAGYVGMSLSALLSAKHKIRILDIDENKVKLINSGFSTVEGRQIDSYLKKNSKNIYATSSPHEAFANADFVIIATPTNYNEKSNYFDTSSVDEVVSDVNKINKDAFIVIKSTLPVGHTSLLQEKYASKQIIFSPEFLREGSALEDNLEPSRIVIGGNCLKSKLFAKILENAAITKNFKTLFVKSSEAEAIKLFANTYLAMRVSFFNELDSFALSKNLNAKNIIEGICLDERIGSSYNNPSFGYGGYCLPKDTKQLQANYKNVPQNLIDAVVHSNATRKKFICEEILSTNPSIVGFYRLEMKKGSKNFRSSAMIDLIRNIINNNVKVIIYEPLLNLKDFEGAAVLEDLDEFKKISQIIVANRMNSDIENVIDKCFTRDIYGID